jgi:hypothetical protein
MPETGVSVTDLLRAGAELRWPESLALVQAIAKAAAGSGWPGDISAFRLRPDGTVGVDVAQSSTDVAQRSTDVAQSSSFAAKSNLAVSSLASFLEQLLPPPGKAVEPRVPAGLRYTLIRARGGVTAPPFQSLRELSESLARFEQGDRETLLLALLARADALPRKGPTAPPVAQASVPAKPSATPAKDVRAAAVTPAPPATQRPVHWEDLRLRPETATVDAARPDSQRNAAGPLLTAAAAPLGPRVAR